MTSCAADIGKLKKYDINVATSNIGYAGTDANIFIMLYGEKGDTGFLPLKKSKTHKLPFYRNQYDKFTVEAPDVGDDITQIRITHDNTGKGPGWHLDYVQVSPEDATCKTTFSANQWLYNKHLEVTLNQKFSKNSCGEDSTTYEIDIKTGNKKGSGTNSNVFIIIYGEKGETGKLLLKDAETKRNLFESSHSDKFIGKAKDIGRITRVRIGHDNKGTAPDWFLDKVSIKTETCSWDMSGWQWINKNRPSIDMYATLEKCKEQTSGTKPSHGGICQRDYRKIGCFKRVWENVPDLLVTDLDPTHKNYTTDMNWDDFVLGLHSLACRCRAIATGHYKYFAIGFHGECVSGKNTLGLEKMFKDDASTDGCINGEMESCDSKSNNECTGAEDYDYFYEIVPQSSKVNYKQLFL